MKNRSIRPSRRQVFMFEVRADDAHVVRPIPACGAGTSNELQPGGDGGGARRFGPVEGQRTGLAAVVQEAFVHRLPPWTSRSRRVGGVEQSSPQLPFHEGRCCLAERKIAVVHVARDSVLVALADCWLTSRLARRWHRLTGGKHCEWAAVGIFGRPTRSVLRPGCLDHRSSYGPAL
jgi:hypothetical protein